MSTMFRSFKIFNYRVWFIGALVSNVGAWMQSTAQSWVVLTQLTDTDAAAMGITMALQFAPPLLLVSVTGLVADRFDRRKLLILTQVLMMLLAGTIGVLLLNGLMTLPLMYGFALALGIVNAFDSPARQAFISDLVSRENASNAVALNAASFNTARLIGPALAGVLIVAVGSGWVFIINAGTFIAMLIALLLVRTKELVPRVREVVPQRLSDGFKYVAQRPDLIVIFIIVFLVGAFGMNFNIYASTMAISFGREADGFGLLSSILAIGSVFGALLAARRDRPRMRLVVAASGLFGVAALVSAFMPTFFSYGAVLMVVGFSVVTMMSTANGYVQTTTEPAVRGRVLALYMAVLMGGTPIGAPLVGWVADEFGPRVAIGVGAVAAFIACLVGLIWMLRAGHIERSPRSRFWFTVTETRPISTLTTREIALAQGEIDLPLPDSTNDSDKDPEKDSEE